MKISKKPIIFHYIGGGGGDLSHILHLILLSLEIRGGICTPSVILLFY